MVKARKALAKALSELSADELEHYEESAARREYDSGASRVQAEFEALVDVWRKQDADMAAEKFDT